MFLKYFLDKNTTEYKYIYTYIHFAFVGGKTNTVTRNNLIGFLIYTCDQSELNELIHKRPN